MVPQRRSPRKPKMRCCDPRPRGMTLIEVLVALAVVAITLTAGLKAAGGLTVNAQRLTDLTLAQWCVENQLVSIKLTRSFPPVGVSEFQCVQLGRELAGELNTKAVPANPDFRQLEVQVFDEGRHTILRLATVVPRY
jgi:general secretion pathway protein I